MSRRLSTQNGHRGQRYGAGQRAANKYAEIADKNLSRSQIAAAHRTNVELNHKNLESNRKVADLQVENARLAKKAGRDALTGLPNLDTITEYYENLRMMAKGDARAQRGDDDAKHSIGIIYFDIDDFKQYNTQFGHDGGDETLKQLGKIVNQSIRSQRAFGASDMLARKSGDEFIILVPITQNRFRDEFGDNMIDSEVSTDTMTALQITTYVAEKVRASVEAGAIELNGRKEKVTVSLGCAVFPVSDAPDFKDALIPADHALYHAKTHAGGKIKNAVGVFHDGRLLSLDQWKNEYKIASIRPGSSPATEVRPGLGIN